MCSKIAHWEPFLHQYELQQQHTLTLQTVESHPDDGVQAALLQIPNSDDTSTTTGCHQGDASA